MPDPDWRLFNLPEVRKDFCHFHPVVPGELDAMLLTSKAALAPLLDHSTQVNSDFFPVLDLGAERSRYLGPVRRRDQRPLPRPLRFRRPGRGTRPILPDDRRGECVRHCAPDSLDPHRDRACDSADTRSNRPTRPGSIHPMAMPTKGSAAGSPGVRAGEPASSWALWAREYNSAFTAWHAGTRGWMDSSFTGRCTHGSTGTRRRRRCAPTVEFRELLARGAYRDAAVPSATPAGRSPREALLGRARPASRRRRDLAHRGGPAGRGSRGDRQPGQGLTTPRRPTSGPGS